MMHYIDKKNMPWFLCFIMVWIPVMMASGQSRVKQSDLEGTWNLVLDLREEMDDQEDKVGTRMLLGALDGLLTGITWEISFQSDNRLKIVTESYGNTKVEWSTWHLRKGKLYLGETDSYSFKDIVWMKKRRRLAAYVYNEKGKLVRKPSLQMSRLN